MMKSLPIFFGALGLALAAGGCASKPEVTDPARRGPVFIPRNYAGDPRLPQSVQRVLLLPVHGGDAADPDSAESLDSIFAIALERQMRFEVVTMSRDECLRYFGAPDLGSTDALPHDLLRVLGDKYAADAVVFVDITAYRAYRPLTLGVRAKLAAVSSHHLIWAFDQVFSASDPTVANGARRYYLASEGGPVPYDPTA